MRPPHIAIVDSHRERHDGARLERLSRLQTMALATIEDARSLALSLPRTTEAIVRGRVKFQVGRIVYLAFSRDETVMGFAFPKEEREWLVGTEPEKFLMPAESDLHYDWVHLRLAAIDVAELRELVFDAWRMVVPKSVAAAQELEPLE